MKFFLNSHHNWVQLCTNIHWLNAISSRWSENFAARLRHAATAWWRRAKLPVSRPGYRSVWFFDITYTIDIHRTYCHSILQKNLWLIPYFMLLENAPLWPCVECIDKRPYIRIIHRTIMITINKITSETFSCYLTSLAMFACIPWLNTSINNLLQNVWNWNWPLCPSIHHMRDTSDYFLTVWCICLKNVIIYIHVSINLDFRTFLCICNNFKISRLLGSPSIVQVLILSIWFLKFAFSVSQLDVRLG